jgi:hypothetical protein
MLNCLVPGSLNATELQLEVIELLLVMDLQQTPIPALIRPEHVKGPSLAGQSSLQAPRYNKCAGRRTAMQFLL